MAKLERLMTMFRGGLGIGENGTRIAKAIIGSAAGVNPPSIGATSRGVVTFPVTGAKVGDGLIVNPPATLNDDLVFVGAAITANDLATIYLYNPTAGAIDDAALTWIYTWFKKG